jgi:ribosomal protein S18 acetylase RimI-like enzyme
MMNIRPYQPSDIDDIIQIERQSFPRPATKPEFLAYLTQRALCIVAEDNGLIVGYMLYQLLPGLRNICSIGVLHDCRRRGVGSALVAEVKRLTAINLMASKRVEATILASYHADGFLEHCGMRLVREFSGAQLWRWDVSEGGGIEAERIEE